MTLGWLALCVAVAGLSDLVDGTIARRLGSTSQVGAALDPIMDGLFYGGVALGLAFGGAYPLWLGAVVVLRYLVPVAAGGVLYLAHRLPRFQHTFFGRLSTTLIAVLLGGIALFRLPGLAVYATVLIPLVTLLAWVDLGWTAARLSRPR